ncbi:MAG: hypothetical protein WC123_03965 [Bacilli bacterium]|nr:hypothetical protein [Bacilli bacterium]
MNKKLKENMKNEFNSIIPDVLNQIVNTPVVKEEVNYSSDNIYNFIKFKAVFAMVALLFFIAVGGAGGYTYYNPMTFLTISISPSILDSIISNMSSSNEEIKEETGNYMLKLGINQFDYVVEAECDSQQCEVDLNNLGLINRNYSEVLQDIVKFAQSRGYIDVEHNVGNIKISVLADYQSHASEIESYIGNQLPDAIGIGGYNKVIVINNPSIEECPYIYQMDPYMNPVRAMAIQEIMFYTNEYSFDELAKKSNRQLVKILMQVRRNYYN